MLMYGYGLAGHLSSLSGYLDELRCGSFYSVMFQDVFAMFYSYTCKISWYTAGVNKHDDFLHPYLPILFPVF